MRRKRLSVLLALCMVLSLLPMSALAATFSSDDTAITVTQNGVDVKITGTVEAGQDGKYSLPIKVQPATDEEPTDSGILDQAGQWLLDLTDLTDKSIVMQRTTVNDDPYATGDDAYVVALDTYVVDVSGVTKVPQGSEVVDDAVVTEKDDNKVSLPVDELDGGQLVVTVETKTTVTLPTDAGTGAKSVMDLIKDAIQTVVSVTVTVDGESFTQSSEANIEVTIGNLTANRYYHFFSFSGSKVTSYGSAKATGSTFSFMTRHLTDFVAVDIGATEDEAAEFNAKVAALAADADDADFMLEPAGDNEDLTPADEDAEDPAPEKPGALTVGKDEESDVTKLYPVKISNMDAGKFYLVRVGKTAGKDTNSAIFSVEGETEYTFATEKGSVVIVVELENAAALDKLPELLAADPQPLYETFKCE